MAAKKDKVGNVPNLRFPGFTAEFEIKKLGDIATFSKGKGISKSDIEEHGITECIRYGELYTHYTEVINEIKSRTNVNTSTLVLSEKNDVIIPASGETTIDIATASCVLKSGIALGGDLNIIKTENNGVFLSYYLNSKKKMEIANLAQGISVVHLYSSQLASLNLSLPKLNEQDRISSFLALLDERIRTQNKIIEELKSLKDATIKSIFKKEVHFKNEQGKSFSEWQKKNLGNLTIIINNRNKKNEKLPVYSINNKKGFVPQGDQFEGVDSNSRGYDISIYKVIKNATFAYNPARINVGSIGYSGNLDNILVSSLYVCFKTTAEIDDEFLFQYVKMESFNQQVLEFMEGGVRSYLFYENFSKITLGLPCLEEQIKIAKMLSSIDRIINNENELLEKMFFQKKYLLNNLFI